MKKSAYTQGRMGRELRTVSIPSERDTRVERLHQLVNTIPALGKRREAHRLVRELIEPDTESSPAAATAAVSPAPGHQRSDHPEPDSNTGKEPSDG